MPPGIDEVALRVSRRTFLGCCAALAQGACTSLTHDTRATHALVTDPALQDYEAVLDGLVRTVLPFEHPDFPVTPRQVYDRLLTLFRLETDPRFLTLQRWLQLFDQTALFPDIRVVTREEQRVLDASARGLDPNDAIARALRQDQEIYAQFGTHVHEGVGFAALDLSGQRAYFDLWRRSGFVLKREFHASARSLVMISAYSMDAVWAAIGYGGPLVTRPSMERT